MLTTRGGARKGAGRPKLPPVRRKTRHTVTIAPDDLRFLKDIDPSITQAIRTLVQRAKEH